MTTVLTTDGPSIDEIRDGERECRARIDTAQSRALDLTSRAEKANRALTDGERDQLTMLREEVDSMTAQADMLARMIQGNGTHTRSASGPDATDPAVIANRAAMPITGNSTSTARPPVTLKRTDSFVDWARTNTPARPETRGFDLGRAIRGLATGEWNGADIEQRSMTEGTLGAGGYTIPALVSADIIDKARNAARVIQLGAQTLPMPNMTFRLPRLDTDATAAWRNESASISDSTPAITAADLTARSLACLVKVSVELLEDAPTLGDFLVTAIGEAMATELDRAALRGTGTAPEPRGIKNTSGIGLITNGTNGLPVANFFGQIIPAIGTCRAANFEPNGILYSARTATNIDGLTDSTYQPMAKPDIITNLQSAWTNQIPTNIVTGSSNNTTEIYVGDWTYLTIGMRSEIRVRLLDQRYADTGEVGLLAMMRADVVVTRPAAFTLITGITN